MQTQYIKAWLWILVNLFGKKLLQEIRCGNVGSIILICKNHAALHIASNLVFHEKTKEIEIGSHFGRWKIESGCIAINFITSNDQLTDILINKLGAYDIYIPARG